MEFVVISAPAEVNFSPTQEEEILQNIKFILTTIIGSVPLDRRFGMNAVFLDRPTEMAKAMFASDVYEKIHQYEPRATVLEINYEERKSGDTSEGRVYAAVKVDINV